MMQISAIQKLKNVVFDSWYVRAGFIGAELENVSFVKCNLQVLIFHKQL